MNSDRFTCMTLNLQGYDASYGSWESRRELIRNVMVDRGVDVAAFQCVGFIDETDQCAELAPPSRSELRKQFRKV